MKAIISPARKMRTFTSPMAYTAPIFHDETATIIKKMKLYSPWELESLLSANEKLAFQSYQEFQEFDEAQQRTAAIFAYDGLVYKNIVPTELSSPALDYATQALRIVSALYGIVKPFDEIQPYRLEMQTKTSIEGENLYDFWGDKLYKELFREGDCVINLASEEYAKSFRKHLSPGDSWIDVVFLTTSNGKSKVATTLAKMARGQMVRYILENRLTDPAQLQAFSWNGLEYESSLSYYNRLVFR